MSQMKLPQASYRHEDHPWVPDLSHGSREWFRSAPWVWRITLGYSLKAGCVACGTIWQQGYGRLPVDDQSELEAFADNHERCPTLVRVTVEQVTGDPQWDFRITVVRVTDGKKEVELISGGQELVDTVTSSLINRLKHA